MYLSVEALVSRHRQTVAQIRQIGVHPIPPRIPERLTCSGSRVMWPAFPSFTSRLVVLHWKFELNLIPYGGSM